MSNEKITIDLAGLADYTPVEGFGSSSLLAKDGLYKCTITKMKSDKSKSGNNKFTVNLTVQDEDEKGATLIGDILLSGVDKNGSPNVRQLGDLLLSVGMSQEAIRALAPKGVIDAEAMAGNLTGKTAHVSVEAETYNGNMTSRPRNYVAPQRYTDAVAASAHRKPRKADTAFAGAPAGVTTGPATVGGKSNGAAPGGLVDPMKALAGLDLKI
jgi:hypothetical protein